MNDDPFRRPLPPDDPFARDSVRAADARRRRIPGCAVIACLLLILVGGMLFSPIPGRIKRGIIEIAESRRAPAETPEPEVIIREKIVEKIVEVPVPMAADVPEMPDGPVRYRRIEVAELFNGIQIETELQSEDGDIASKEREEEDSYQARFEIKIRVPKPNTTVAQLSENNPALPKLLREFPLLVESAEVSRFFYHLYDLKQRQVQANLTRLETVLSRHNFYDCDTVLEIEHPSTGRRIFFVQGEMDVVSDGSDGDRMPEFDLAIANSQHFQPSTSYGWAKRTDQANPMIAILEEKLKKHQERYKVRGLTRAENAFLEEQIESIPRQIKDLKSRSYLVAQADPFIVIPLSTRPYLDTNPFMPRVGDYAVVIHGEKLLPAIVGDYGPTTKTGEASLRIARELDPASSPYRRPVSDLTVSYLVFPNTADRPFGPPDLAKWHQRCSELLAEIGGIGDGFALHEWDDLLAPKPDPEPVSVTPSSTGATEDGEKAAGSETVTSNNEPEPAPESSPETTEPATTEDEDNAAAPEADPQSQEPDGEN